MNFNAEATLRAKYLYAANTTYLNISPSYTINIVNNSQASVAIRYTTPTLLAQIVQPKWVNTEFNFTSYAEIRSSSKSIVLANALSGN